MELDPHTRDEQTGQIYPSLQSPYSEDALDLESLERAEFPEEFNTISTTSHSA